jgi:hypothetical protein
MSNYGWNTVFWFVACFLVHLSKNTPSNLENMTPAVKKRALEVLVSALHQNKSSVSLWKLYLKLFIPRSEFEVSNERHEQIVADVFDKAVEITNSFVLWTMFVMLLCIAEIG